MILLHVKKDSFHGQCSFHLVIYQMQACCGASLIRIKK